MLYRDPKGETVGNFTPSSIEASGPNQLGTNQSSTNKEEKVTLLKALKEKENKINELTLEIQTLKVIMEGERERGGGRGSRKEGDRMLAYVYICVQGEAHQHKEENEHEINGTNETNKSNHTTVL